MEKKTKTKIDKLENIIKRSTYYYVNDNLNSKNFPIPEKVETEDWKIIKMGKTVTSQEALDKIKDEGCRPANAYELALWSETHREEIEKGTWLVALGQSWQVSDGNHRVPRVGARSDGDFTFGLGALEDVWCDLNAFLCFCDSTLSLGHSETQPSDSLTLRVQKLEETVEKLTRIINVGE